MTGEGDVPTMLQDPVVAGIDFKSCTRTLFVCLHGSWKPSL